MFSSSHSDKFPDFDDDWFKGHESWDGSPVMEIVVSLGVVVAAAVLLALCCKCCCGARSKGRVLQPPPDPEVGVAVGPPVAYPQQQYNTVTVPTGMIVGNVSGYPPPVASPYPAAAPFPAAAGAPYPAAAGAPYPAAAPYPTAHYPAGMPLPASQPSAPDAHAVGLPGGSGAWPPPPPPAAPAPWYPPHPLPPSYEQVMSAEEKHSTPYNPYAPH